MGAVFFLSLKLSEYTSTLDYAIHYKMLRNPLTRNYAHVLFSGTLLPQIVVE